MNVLYILIVLAAIAGLIFALTTNPKAESLSKAVFTAATWGIVAVLVFGAGVPHLVP